MGMASFQNWIYLLAGAALLGVSFFFLMRSANKNLEELKSKSKKRR
ncbi:LPXTG cell wall anchor domain-containing protein [Acetivibrio cellulolyticus]|nr:LPXTG cell wall anchor domain-containing protein [Acetivibrio cellulolyticus]